MGRLVAVWLMCMRATCRRARAGRRRAALRRGRARGRRVARRRAGRRAACRWGRARGRQVTGRRCGAAASHGVAMAPLREGRRIRVPGPTTGVLRSALRCGGVGIAPQRDAPSAATDRRAAARRCDDLGQSRDRPRAGHDNEDSCCQCSHRSQPTMPSPLVARAEAVHADIEESLHSAMQGQQITLRQSAAHGRSGRFGHSPAKRCWPLLADLGPDPVQPVCTRPDGCRDPSKLSAQHVFQIALPGPGIGVAHDARSKT
jgi:hypothetical protein